MGVIIQLPKKKKTFILTVSKIFLGDHPKKGQITSFKNKILDNIKIHTMRGNFKYWSSIVKKVNSGQAILSVRQWTDKPYHLDENGIGQIEIARFEKLGYQKVKYNRGKLMTIDGKRFTEKKDFKKIAKNDGLTLDEFNDWFPEKFTGIIIHFTDFKY